MFSLFYVATYFFSTEFWSNQCVLDVEDIIYSLEHWDTNPLEKLTGLGFQGKRLGWNIATKFYHKKKKKNVFLETLLFLGEKEDKSRFLEKVLFKSKVGIFTPNSDSNILYPVVLKKLFGVRYQFGHHFHFGQKPS